MPSLTYCTGFYFIIYFRLGDKSDDSSDFPAYIKNDGRVRAFSQVHLQSFCELDMSEFPHDQHECRITIGTWGYDVAQVSFVSFRIPSHVRQYKCLSFVHNRFIFDFGRILLILRQINGVINTNTDTIII